jgi:hypothetical protein
MERREEMRQILGRVFLILFLTINIFAGVNVSVSSPAVYRGDIVNFTISADGKDIEFPNIREIAGFTIIGNSSAQSINMINGEVTRTISKTYSFKPTKSVVIPSLSVNADGKLYKTKELKVEVLKPTASKNGEPFVIEMKLDKKEAFVGEAVRLTITFKRKLNARLNKLQLGEPKLEDFWVKKIDGVKRGSEGDYIFEKKSYQLFPQKDGEFKIPPLEALIGIAEPSRGRGVFDDPFFSSFTRQLNWQKIYSNEQNLTVHPLPNGLELYGEYNIRVGVDKRRVNANEPVNIIITVEGKGNIDDVKKFNFTIDNTMVHTEDEPKISSKLINGVYQGRFTQKIVIISDGNFTIPSLELKYFDKSKKEIKTIKSNPIKIEVIGGNKGLTKPSTIEVTPNSIMQKPQIKTITKTKIVKEDGYIKYILLILGFILGATTVLGFNRFKNRAEKRESNIVKAIKKAKSDKDLFNILLPFAKKDVVISDALNRLEQNIYRGGKNSIDKEEIIDFLQN